MNFDMGEHMKEVYNVHHESFESYRLECYNSIHLPMYKVFNQPIFIQALWIVYIYSLLCYFNIFIITFLKIF
jgi:hypothetical protein